MRAIILASTTALIFTALAWAALAAIGTHPQLRPAAAALAAAIVASILSGLPLALVDRSVRMNVMQAGLGGTVIHMLFFAVAAGLLILGHLPIGSSCIFWLGAMYVATLGGLVAGILSAVRATPNMVTA